MCIYIYFFKIEIDNAIVCVTFYLNFKVKIDNTNIFYFDFFYY